MSYLYGEARADERAPLAAHLRKCAVCGAQVTQWQAAIRDLDAWQLRPHQAEPHARAAQRNLARPFLQWAAALVLLGAGFAFGRVGLATVEAKRLRAAIEPEIRQQLREEFDAKRLEDSRAIYAALEKLDARRIADYVALKKELDTVAVLTDAGLRTAEQQLARLAGYTQAAEVSNTPER